MLVEQNKDTLICTIEAVDIQEAIEELEEAEVKIRNNITNGNIKEGIIIYSENVMIIRNTKYKTKIREEVY